MKTFIISVLCMAAVAIALAVVPDTENAARAETPNIEAKQLYTCGMHPEIISDEPGICPICNMRLTPKRDVGDGSGVVRIDPATTQNMGLVTTEATYASISRTVRTSGRIAIPDPNRHSVNVKINGWVEKLFVSEEGEHVFKGQPLLELYSPDLVAAQKELLVAMKSNPKSESMSRFARMAEDRLRNWDISEDQLTRLKESGEVSRTLKIRAPADGFVLSKRINAGDKVSAMSVLYEIADLSSVWVKAFVYEQDLPFVSVGQFASVTTPALPGTKLKAGIIYLSPTLNNKGQAEIRFALDNSSRSLRPDMFADVTIDSPMNGVRLVIPRPAVINSGIKQIVYVSQDSGRYEPRSIVTGLADDNDMIEITEGLMPGEKVVVSGQFLLDSESRLNESIGHGSSHLGHSSGMSMISASTTVKTEAVVDPYDIHTCPMPSHFHVLKYGPGVCPECNMKLVQVSETKNKPVYVCPMPQCGTATKKPGVCPVCNMNLTEYLPADTITDSVLMSSKMNQPETANDKMKDSTTTKDPYDIHTCPMPSHFHVLNYGPGTCPECNMKLVPVSETKIKPVYVCPMPQCGTAVKEPGVCPVCKMNLIEYEPEKPHDH